MAKRKRTNNDRHIKLTVENDPIGMERHYDNENGPCVIREANNVSQPIKS